MNLKVEKRLKFARDVFWGVGKTCQRVKVDGFRGESSINSALDFFFQEISLN